MSPFKDSLGHRAHVRLPIIALAFGALFTLAVWAVWLEPASLTVTEERLDLPWPSSRQLRVAVLTDLHVGSPFNGLEKLRETAARTNAVRPDLICLLGDLVIQGVLGGRFVPPEAIAAELAKLRAPAGVVAVLGNHDGWLDHDRVRRALEGAGIRVVEDAAVRVDTPAGPIWIAGLSDLWTGRADLARALGGVPEGDSPVLLLTHNPDVFPEVSRRVTLTLAGHTHGGQVRLPLVGPPIVPSRYGRRYAAGHIVEGGRHLYVATGVGTSILPFRFRVPPAIALLTVGGGRGRLGGPAVETCRERLRRASPRGTEVRCAPVSNSARFWMEERPEARLPVSPLELRSLRLPTVLRRGPYRFYFYSHEPHEPAHVHVDRDEQSAKFWLDPVMLARNLGFSPRELRRIEGLVLEHREQLLESWHEEFGP